MYSAHQGGQALRTIFSAPRINYDRDGKQSSFWGMKGSASLRDKDLVLTVVNPSVQEPREAEIAVRGASVRSGAATVLSHSDIHAHNSFKQTDMVHPQNETLEVKGRTLNYTLRPASVTRLTLSLA